MKQSSIMTVTKIKKRKVSKKNKKSWRKHVDIKDVDKFLENTRLDERLGSYANCKDSDLFVISTEPEKLPKKVRREIAQSKEPRCFNILKPHTSVPDPITKRNRVRTKEERKHVLLVQKEAIRKARGILKLKEKEAIKNKIVAEAKRLSRPKRGEFNNDLWQDTSIKEIETDWMSSATARHTLSHFGMKKKRIPNSLIKKPSVLPAIEMPHPGASYNPSFEDHQNLLREVAEREMKLIKEEEHLERVTTKMFKKVSREEKEKNLLQELSEGLKTEEKENSSEDDSNVQSVNPPVKNSKKTRVQRRKQREQKQLAHKRQQEKIEKRKVSDIYKLKLIDNQLAAKDRKERLLRENRLKKKTNKVADTKTLSKIKFEPLEPDFKLAEELTGNLRNSEPTGSLLKDRFKSLQQRNIVAPSTLKLKQNKAKVKRFIKPDHKIDASKLK